MDSTELRIFNRIRQVCVNVLKVKEEQISGASRFKEDLGADSLDTIILLMSLEEEFKNRISDEEAQGLKTIQDVIALVKAKQLVAL